MHFVFLRCLPRHEVGSDGSVIGVVFVCDVVVDWKSGRMAESNLINETENSYYCRLLSNCKS